MTKKQIKLAQELSEIIKTFGYWSKEVLDFNSSLNYYEVSIINNSAKQMEVLK